jgi:hypothetical protein
MDNSKKSNPVVKNLDEIAKEKNNFQIMSEEEMNEVKGGYSCSCNDKRIRRSYSYSYSYYFSYSYSYSYSYYRSY